MAEQIQEGLTCSLCLEVFKQPKNLTCGHSFCLQCLKQLVSAQGHCNNVRCPECRQHTNVPQGNLDNLVNNFATLRIIDALKDNKKPNDQENVCGFCEEKKPLESFCKTCSTFLCKGCTKVHKKSRELARHQVCNMTEIPDVHKAKADTKITELKSIHSTWTNRMTRFDQMCVETKESCREIKSEIESEADRLHKFIDAMKRDLLEKVDKFQAKKLSTIEGLKENIQIQIGSIQVLQTRIEQMRRKMNFDGMNTHLRKADNLKSSSAEDLSTETRRILNTKLILKPSTEIVSLGELHEGKYLS